MSYIKKSLDSVVAKLSDDNYDQSIAFYRLWFGIAHKFHRFTSDRISDVIWSNRGTNHSIDPDEGKLIHPTAHLIVRFTSDMESDHSFAPQTAGLQTRLCAMTLQGFFSDNMEAAWDNESRRSATALRLYIGANFIAHWANLGCIEEDVICNQILQSLLSHPKLHDHQADTLFILFKLAGATFEAYADPLVVDRCFELLKDHYNHGSVEQGLVKACAARIMKDSHRVNANFQEIIALRERGWEGLPPPPIFMTGKSKPAGASQKDPAATPVATSLGLPNQDLKPQTPQTPPLESVTAPESDAIPASPVTQSPSISISTLSDFTVADISGDESPIDPAISDTSDDEGPIDPTAATPHETFYLDDGNVEVLCGNTLFRVHVSTLSFHSPTLRRMFVQTNLAAAESPNGCPRILSPDAPRDFAMLLKTIYFPGFVAVPTRCRAAPLITYSFPDSPNGIKYRISPHSRPCSESPQSMRCPLSDLRYSRSFVMHIQRHLRG